MSKIRILLFFTLALMLSACGGSGGGEDGGDSASGAAPQTPGELSLRQTHTGNIAAVGEVDWYHYRVVEANVVLQVKLTSNTYRPDVDLLVTVYELDGNGQMVRLYADHALEGSQLPADIKMNVYIDAPKEIYISVRDLMDDEASGNSYFLSIDYAYSIEAHENFSQAAPLTVDSVSGCRTDSIDAVGDVDIFKFVTPGDGVYDISIDFSPFAGGTDVELSIELYDSDGVLIQSLSRGQGNTYHLVPYLAEGLYYVLIDDYGRDDFDASSPYEICVATVNADEARLNDEVGNALDMQYDSSSQTFTASGALEYYQDLDWYRLPLDTIPANGIKVLQVTFDDGQGNAHIAYRVQMQDGGSIPLLDHSFAGGSAPYQTQIKAGGGDHYILIQSDEGQLFSIRAPYTVTVQVFDVDDPAEAVVKAEGVGNNTITTADLLVPSPDPNAFTEAKIAFRGDEDWYEVTVNDTGLPQILEVFLDTNSLASHVDFNLSIMRDSVLKRVYDANGSDGGTELKTSILVPSTGAPLTYYFRVSDYQNDEGDGTVSYRIRANVNSIPLALPADPAITGTVVYHDEASEIADGSAETVRVEQTSLNQGQYKANTSLLEFNVASPLNGIQKVKIGSATTITFPWIAGYIDYQDDEDWFKVDLSELLEDPAGSWYYEIRVDMHTGAPGSLVEYVWKLYRDRNGNQILVDRPGDSNGFFASAGDVDIIQQAFDVVTPSGSDDPFWAGDAWEGGFYISMSDFNYVNAPHPDDDWGYDGAPYYFKLTLVYHPGASHP